MSHRTLLLVFVFLAAAVGFSACSTSQSATRDSADAPKSAAPADNAGAEDQAKTEPAQDPASDKTHLIRVAIGFEAIRVDGEQVVELVDGVVPGSQKKGGESSMLITPLFEALQQLVQHIKAQAEAVENSTAPRVEISTSPLVGYRVLTEVMYSAGQADIRHFEFVAEQPNGTSIRFIAASPRLDTGPFQDESENDKLHLTALVAPGGFMVGAKSGPVPPVTGCPKQGMPICPIDPDADLASLVDSARDARREGNTSKAMQLLSQVVESYDYQRLYNTLTALKKRYKDHPDSMNITTGAAGQLPMPIVARLIQAIRYQLPQEQYEDREKFRSAVESVKESDELFSRITFVIVM